MNELIAIRNLQNLKSVDELKKDLIMFDKIHIVGLKQLYYSFEGEQPKKTTKLVSIYDFALQEGYSYIRKTLMKTGEWDDKSKLKQFGYKNDYLEFLVNEGKIIFDEDDIVDKSKASELYKTLEPIVNEKLYFSNNNPGMELAKFTNMCHDLKVRAIKNSINRNQYTAISDNSSIYNIENITNKHTEVYNLILHDFPLLDKNTSFEKILDFKRDQDVYNSIWGLRNWVSKVSNTELSLNEIEEEYRYLIYKYEQSIKLHKLKTQNSSFQTILQTTSELAENIAKFKFKSITDMLFKFNDDKISLMESELNNEGNQFSYLFKTKQYFGKK